MFARGLRRAPAQACAIPSPTREQRSHGEDYPGSNEPETPEEQYDAPPSGPGEAQPPDSGSKPKPSDR